MTFVLTRRCVEDDDSAVAVAVGHVDFIRACVDVDVSRPAEVIRIVTAAGLVPLADLQQPLAVRVVLQDHVIVGAVAADPDIVFVVDEDPVLLLGPAVGGYVPFSVLLVVGGSAPRAQHVAFPAELDYRWCGNAAIRVLRVLYGTCLVRGQGTRPLNDPDVVIAVDRDTGNLSEDPVVGQRSRPGRVDSIRRHVGPLGVGDARPGGISRCIRRIRRTARE